MAKDETIEGCQPTFLGQVCKIGKGFTLTKGKMNIPITPNDARTLLEGGIVSLDELQGVQPAPKKEPKASKAKTQKNVKKTRPSTGGG